MPHVKGSHEIYEKHQKFDLFELTSILIDDKS